MKTTGVCPRCASRHVVRVQSEVLHANSIKVGAFAFADVTRYICTACGYIEQYIEDDAALAKLRGQNANRDTQD